MMMIVLKRTYDELRKLYTKTIDELNEATELCYIRASKITALEADLERFKIDSLPALPVSEKESACEVDFVALNAYSIERLYIKDMGWTTSIGKIKNNDGDISMCDVIFYTTDEEHVRLREEFKSYIVKKYADKEVSNT
jgi:hypothetical protein